MRKIKKQKTSNILKYTYSIFILIAILVLIFNEFGAYKLYSLNARKQKLDNELSSLYKQQDQLREENLRLEIDLEYIEKIAREKYMMVKDNEKVYRIRYEKNLSSN
jgi:cell division protein FtsB